MAATVTSAMHRQPASNLKRLFAPEARIVQDFLEFSGAFRAVEALSLEAGALSFMVPYLLFP